MGVMNDDRFEAMVREAARDYHRPPETPREEMWAAIEAERRRRRAAPRIVTLRPAWRWGLGMAAVLLVGIAIGRGIQPRAGTTGPTPTGASTQSGGGIAYRLATAQYLARTETLLAGFRADAPKGRTDQLFISQARDLLMSTRLLLDSPAGRDLRLKQLLEDLELVLAQIALLHVSGDKRDMEIITQGIDQRSVLIRLRTAIPSGPAGAPRTQGVI
jgi:hypothetical protein